MTRTLIRIALLNLLFVPAAFAVDGVLEINQASVAASGGFPFAISQPGSYRLTSNVVVPSGATGITASADDVRLDLNGFSLIGPGSCFPNIDGGGKLTSVSCSGLSGTGVEGLSSLSNGTIRGFDVGVAHVADRAVELDRMLLTQNGTGLEAIGGDGSIRIGASRFSTNFNDGVNTLGFAGNAVVVDSAFERNGGYGLYLSSGLASHSSFAQNKAEGLRSNAGRGAVIESCYFEDNGFGVAGFGVGYRGSVFVDNTTNVGLGPVQLGDNLCGGSLCP